MTSKRGFLLGMLAWTAYVALRTLAQRLMPSQNWAEFVPQDLAVSALRLACGLACLWIARQRWYDSALGIAAPAPLSALAALAGLACVATEVMGAMAQRPEWGLPHWIRAVEVGVALIVAFNEEVGFRLLAYSGLRDLAGRQAAVLLSSLLFTAMHIGYQPGFHLYKIFFLGLFFAWMRDRGVSLYWLVAIHFATDSVNAVTLSGVITNWRLYQASVPVAALAAALAYLSPERHAPGGEALLFAYGSLLPGQPEAASLGVTRRCDVVGTGEVQGRLSERNGYPALSFPKKGAGLVPGLLLRLRDKSFLAELDAYEGDDYIRDKAFIQMENGVRCEAWIYVAASGPGA